MLPHQAETCKEAEAIAVIQGLPLLYATNHPLPLPLHNDFLYRFTIDFQGGKLRHPVWRSHSLLGVTFSCTVHVHMHS